MMLAETSTACMITAANWTVEGVYSYPKNKKDGTSYAVPSFHFSLLII
jgi:hypothetical protein